MKIFVATDMASREPRHTQHNDTQNNDTQRKGSQYYDTQNNDIQHYISQNNDNQQNNSLHITLHDRHLAKHYAQCHYDECRYTRYIGAKPSSVFSFLLFCVVMFYIKAFRSIGKEKN
jgi:hypothetical protein